MALLKQNQNSSLPAPTGPDEDFLIVAEGHLSGNRLKLSLPAVHLGSDINCDIWLPHEDIMPWHALLFKKDTRWLVKSLDPTQPVLVNGSAVNTSVLANGDRLGLGRLIFVLETPDTGRQPSSPKAEDIYSGLRVHATAVSAAQVDLYQREAKLADEKRRWKIRCTQIAKELSRRQEILRKKNSLLLKASASLKKGPLTPAEDQPKSNLQDQSDSHKVLSLIAAVEERTQSQRRRLAQVYWNQRQGTAKRFVAWEKALARREAALERSWQALVSKHKKKEQEAASTLLTLEQRENTFQIRLLESEQSLQIREKALKNAEKQSALQNRRISEETDRLRASQREWISRLEALHREESALKRRVENLSAQIDRNLPPLPWAPETTQTHPENSSSSQHHPDQVSGSVPQSSLGLILSESLAILSNQRETLVRQAEALAARDLEWIQEQKAAACSLEESLVSLSHQEHLLAEKHAQLDRLLEENASLQTQLDEETKALKNQRRQEMENAAGLHTRLVTQETFLEERRDRLAELEKKVEELSSRQHGGIIRYLELAREAAVRAESREKSLSQLEQDLRKNLEENQFHWQTMALERAELEALRAELLASAKMKPEALANRLREARATAGERTAGWLRILDAKHQELARELASSRATWTKLAELLIELESALNKHSRQRQGSDMKAFALLRHQEEAAFWREEMERLNAELSARAACVPEIRATLPLMDRLPTGSMNSPIIKAA